MELDLVAAWAAVAVAIAAAAISWREAVKSRRSADQAEARANDAREALVSAQESARDALARSADAHEALAIAAGRYIVPWRLEREEKGLYRLVNAGPEDALDVALDVQGAVKVINADPRERIPAAGEASFSVMRAWSSNWPTLTVTWRRPDGDEHEWTTELPPQ